MGLESGLAVEGTKRRERGGGSSVIGRGRRVRRDSRIGGFEDVGEPPVDRRSRGSIILIRGGLDIE